MHAPKTAGNSLQALLAPHSDDRLVASGLRDGHDRFEVEGPVTPRKHASLEEYRALLPPGTIERLLVFTVVRDPWERAVSAYFGPIHWLGRGTDPEWSLDGFRERLAGLETVVSLTSLDGAVALDLVLRFERLEQDTAALLERLGLPAQPLPHRNRGLADRPWRHWYDRHPELIDEVAARFGEDAELFGYAAPTPSAT